jgi:hypothetical protein
MDKPIAKPDFYLGIAIITATPDCHFGYRLFSQIFHSGAEIY